MQLKIETPVLEDAQPVQEVQGRSEPGSDRDDGLLATAVPIMISAYGGALAIVTFTFWQSGETLLSIAVCAVYIVMFFGVPIVMARIRNNHDARWHSDSLESRADRVVVLGGPMRRTEALLQMVIVPLAVLCAFAAFAVIWLTVKP